MIIEGLNLVCWLLFHGVAKSNTITTDLSFVGDVSLTEASVVLSTVLIVFLGQMKWSQYIKVNFHFVKKKL